MADLGLGLDRVPPTTSAKHAAGVEVLNAPWPRCWPSWCKRAALPATVDTKDWDFAMRNLVDAQSYLKSTVDEAGRTTPEFWNQEKDKVDQAWQKAEESFDTVRTATTF